MQPIIVGILPLIGVLIGGTLQFVFGQRLEVRKQLSLQKAQAYIDFFHAVAASGQSRSESNMVLAADAKTRICIYGSAIVVQKLSAFGASGATAFQASGQNALVELLEAMRADVTYDKSLLQREDLNRVLFGNEAGQ